ncbi:MAG: NRDE family protein [Steroidobacteraceae bacterium]
MCLLVVAWQTHAVYRAVLAANRDEFHQRPSAPLAPWQAGPPILAGRDLEAGGTWLGVDRERRFGVVTNFRDLAERRPGAPSRGELIPGWLGGGHGAGHYLAQLAPAPPAYAGFNLLLGDAEHLWYASNRSDPFARPLDPGVYGLSNHLLDTPWPKLLRVRERVRTLLEEDPSGRLAPREHAQRLLGILADRERAELHDLPPTGLPKEIEHKLSSPFVLDPQYGTRSSTVMLLTHAGELHLVERRYDPAGRTTGEDEWHLNPGHWTTSAT